MEDVKPTSHLDDEAHSGALTWTRKRIMIAIDVRRDCAGRAISTSQNGRCPRLALFLSAVRLAIHESVSPLSSTRFVFSAGPRRWVMQVTWTLVNIIVVAVSLASPLQC